MIKSVTYVHEGSLALRQGGVTVQSAVHVVMQEAQDELQFICGRDVHMQTAVQRIRPPDGRVSQAGGLFAEVNSGCRERKRQTIN